MGQYDERQYDLIPADQGRHEAFAPYAGPREITVKKASLGAQYSLLKMHQDLGGAAPHIEPVQPTTPVAITYPNPQIAAAEDLVAAAYRDQPSPQVRL